jgi:hypothetical protein
VSRRRARSPKARAAFVDGFAVAGVGEAGGEKAVVEVRGGAGADPHARGRGVWAGASGGRCSGAAADLLDALLESGPGVGVVWVVGRLIADALDGVVDVVAGAPGVGEGGGVFPGGAELVVLG